MNTPPVNAPSASHRPDHFTRAGEPRLAPLTEHEPTSRHREALVEESRARTPYFALPVRDPDALQARTRADFDIFHNTDDGLPRAERELASTAVSRFNGRVFRGSVHARLAARPATRREDVDRLLAEGVGTDTGHLRWNAVVRAAVALSATPVEFDAEHVAEPRSLGATDADIVDIVDSAAFFTWANRLILSLGEPVHPHTLRASRAGQEGDR
ncbi:peroxidase-related enzyme [Nocardiopsis sp. MG754419]|uniref:peroxidase-related enzyme n=1 Tax=Nocardiopsis sp. MG754419 TaxID=2259865 RepID=UPI001BA7A440|nr:peroxidase-related enzyme [Nocardiopsis sp. MG754419]MBR8740184.1 alkylhydroperoxidase domain protein [Nocardiopsis sp. MG754419]